MTKVDLPEDVWTEVANGVTEQVFNLNNFPNTVANMYYKIFYGASAPAIDSEDVVVVFLDEHTPNISITFSNTAAANIYVMPINSDGKAIL